MENFKILKIESKSMVTKDGLQRVDIDYKSKATVALYLSVYDGETEIVKDILLRCTSGEQKVCVLVPVTDRDFNAKWVIKDECGNVVDSLNAEFKKPRNWTFYVMISSHTDIGLHNSQYYQRYMSEKFLDKAMELCDETDNRTENNRYRYTMEGTWFWNNYGKDRGIEKAKKVVNNYIKNDKIGICGGVAGNMIELYGLEEMCRSTYEKERLKKEWNVDTETICMIDNNGLPWSMVAPYAEAGYKNLIFAPNQWAPINSTIWEMDASKYTPANNPNANGGGSRIDVRYDSELPMVFYWQGKNENEKILVWCSTQYDAGGSAFNLISYQGPNGDGVVCSQFNLVHMGVLFEDCLHQRGADALMLMLRINQDVLNEQDGVSVADAADDACQSFVLVSGQSAKRACVCLFQHFGMLVVIAPAYGLVQGQNFRLTVVGIGLDDHGALQLFNLDGQGSVDLVTQLAGGGVGANVLDGLVQHDLPLVQLHTLLFQRCSDFCVGNSAEQTAGSAALGLDNQSHSPQLLGHFQSLGLFAGDPLLSGLVVHLHGVDGVGGGLDGQLLGQHEVSGVAVGNFNHLALLALAFDVLCQNHFHNINSLFWQ